MRQHEIIDFARADLRNDVAYFERIYTDQTKLSLCKAHANSTIFAWTNWESFLRCKQLESDETLKHFARYNGHPNIGKQSKLNDAQHEEQLSDAQHEEQLSDAQHEEQLSDAQHEEKTRVVSVPVLTGA
jgi:hypothetical protein